MKALLFISAFISAVMAVQAGFAMSVNEDVIKNSKKVILTYLSEML